jgi:hypothetical protein
MTQVGSVGLVSETESGTLPGIAAVLAALAKRVPKLTAALRQGGRDTENVQTRNTSLSRKPECHKKEAALSDMLGTYLLRLGLLPGALSGNSNCVQPKPRSDRPDEHSRRNGPQRVCPYPTVASPPYRS